MAKVFEDFFSELQADMVSICLEYVENNADKIYIYCSFEDSVVSCDYFYDISGTIVKRHKLNNVVSSEFGNYKYDVSIERQDGVLSVINEDIIKLADLCKKYGKAKPTEIKLIYDVSKNSLDAKYKYDIVYSNDPDKTADDIAQEWYDEIKAGKS
jgi:hypothetical protein